MSIKSIILTLFAILMLSGVAIGTAPISASYIQANNPSAFVLESSNCAPVGGSVVMKSTISSAYDIIQETPDNSQSDPSESIWSTAPDFATQGANNYYLLSVLGAGYYPYYGKFASNVDGCLDTGLKFKSIGAQISFDKTAYSIGDDAQITVTLNNSNFNTSKYGYFLTVFNPSSAQVMDDIITTSTSTHSLIITAEGNYTGKLFLYEKALGSLYGYYAETNINTVPAPTDPYSFITWDLSNFTVGQTGNIQWGISASIWDSVYNYNLNIYRNDVLVQRYDYISNIGTKAYTFPEAGNYRADLTKSTLFIETVMKSDSATVTQPQDNIHVVDMNGNSKTTFNTSETIRVYGNKYPTTNEKSYFYVVISNGQSLTAAIQTAKIEGVYPYSFALDYTLGVGAYYASLYGVSSLNDCALVDNPSVCYKLKDYKQFTVTAPNNGTTGHPDLNISWGATQYKLWETAHFSYQNATYNDTVKIIDNLGTTKYQFKVNDQGINTLYSGTVQIDSDPKYIGTWTAKIINGSNGADYKTATMQVISASQANYTNDEGITMNWDQPIGQAGQHTLTWNTGTYSGNYTIKLVDGINGNFIMQLPFKTGTVKAQQYTFTLNKAHEYYTAYFINEQSIILSSATIQISSLGAPGATIVPTIDPNSVTSASTNTDIINLLTSKIFWALLFIVGIMLAIAYREGWGR